MHYRHVVMACGKLARDRRADETCAADDENTHTMTPRWCSMASGLRSTQLSTCERDKDDDATMVDLFPGSVRVDAGDRSRTGSRRSRHSCAGRERRQAGRGGG